MRPTRFAHAALLALSLATAAAAQTRRPQEFQAPREMSEQEIADAKERSKSNLNKYGKDTTADVAPFPWMAAGLIVLVLLIAAPFGLKYFKETAGEIRARNAGVPGGGSEGPPAGVPRRRPPPPSPPAGQA